MTNSIETAQQAVIVLQSALPVLGKLLKLANRAKRMFVSPAVSYENILLDFTLDLGDPSGRQASLRRRQVVLFKAREAGVVRGLMWGEGDQLHRLVPEGARRLGVRSEGSRQVLLLSLRRPAHRGSRQEILTRESLRDAFLSSREYFEASVERPTKRLRLRVLFPKQRPPMDVHLQAGSQTRPVPLPVQVGKDGRASLSWSCENPAVDTVYSLRWSW